MKPIQASWVRNPMSVLVVFCSLFEIGLGTGLMQLPGGQRFAAFLIMVIFAVLCLGVFCYVVIWRPWNLYGPGDYQTPTGFLDVIALTHSREALREQQARLADRRLPCDSDTEPTLVTREAARYLLEVNGKNLTLAEHTEAMLRNNPPGFPAEVPSWARTWAQGWWDRAFAEGYLESLFLNVPFVFSAMHMSQDRRVLIQMSPETEAVVKKMVEL